jgi:hypothetical protein
MEIIDNSRPPAPEPPGVREPWMVMLGFMSFKILNAAHDVGLIAYVEKNPDKTQAEIAEALKLPDYSARILLMGCCTIRLLLREPSGGYVLNPDWAKAMGPFGPETYASTTLKVFNDILYRSFTDYTEAVKTGKNVGLDWMALRTPGRQPRFQRGVRRLASRPEHRRSPVARPPRPRLGQARPRRGRRRGHERGQDGPPSSASPRDGPRPPVRV